MSFKIDKKIGNQEIKVELNLSEEEKLQKVIKMASSNGIGCKVLEKVGNKTIKNKAKIKTAPKGVIIVSPPDNDKRIPWDKIVGAERWTHNSFKINLVRDIEGIESPIIYLTNCYSSVSLVDIINDSAKGEDEEGWNV
ncbi:MAG: hypothetical protein FWH29_02410 [Methanobrevibacter sp.]|nr:hypothetical protein [Methanobrevibacter sp.]